jgi:DNA-binding helix-hairpin-helix protein with protein kinase domain
MSRKDDRERRQRQARLDAATRRWDAVKYQWNHETGGNKVVAERQRLEGIRKQYEGLRGEYARDKQRLNNSVREKQLERFLEGFCIDDHDIPLIGPARKATLASFGIESAADIDHRKIMAIHGFGTSLTLNLVVWRKQIEKCFVFDPTKGVDPADVAALDQLYRKKRQQLEAELLAGPERLRQLVADANRQRQSLESEVRLAVSELAQARADMTVV